MTITRTLLLALHAHNSGVKRARDDYATNPTRACGWRYKTDEHCDQLRDTDTYYCPRHRRMRDEMNARQRERKACSVKNGNGMSITLSEDSLLGPPITPLPAEINAAAVRYVVAHGGGDVLEVLGLGDVA